MSDPRFQLLFPETWPRTALAAVLIALAAFVAYHGTFSAPFIFDDLPGIVRNPTIRQLWPLGDVLLPTPASGTSGVGHPIVNLSLALNYAAGGLDVRGYHAVNLLIHIATGVLLFVIFQRLLQTARLHARFDAHAFALALAAALLWTLHPLQTAAVTCVIRRGELLAALCFVLTLYAFDRGAVCHPLDDKPSERPRRGWLVLSVACCLVGMGMAVTMASAPIAVLLYDRTFVARTFSEAWRRRWAFYAALAGTWLLLLFPVSRTGAVGGVVDLTMGVRGWDGLVTLGRAVVYFLRLALWPEPLIFDPGLNSTWPAEHRMYLPLAVIAFGVTAGFFNLGGRRGIVALYGLALLAGGATLRRNADYESALTLWSDTVRKVPANPRAHYHLGNALSAAGRAPEAIAHYETALRLEPGYAAAHHNLGGALLQLGHAAEAVPHYEAALRFEPSSTEAHSNLAAAFIRLGRGAEAVSHYEAAARSGLLAGDEQLRFGRALAEIGRLDDALDRLREAQRLNPRSAETRVVLGMVLSAAGRGPEAVQQFTAAVTIDPADAVARAALGDALIEADRPAEALTHYGAALRLQPGQAAMLNTSMGNALIRLGRVADAIAHYEAALRLNPDDAEARRNLSIVRAAAQRRGLLKK